MISPTFDSDFEWYTTASLKEYSGKWIAILKKKVVASDLDFTKLMEKVDKFDKKPLIAKIPNNKIQII